MMRLPEPTTGEILDKILEHAPKTQPSAPVLVNTFSMIATVIIAGVIWNQISALWLILAVPMAIIGWGNEILNRK